MDASIGSFAFRDAEARDVPALAALEAECFAGDRLSSRSFRDLVRAPSASLTIAEGPDASLAGYALVLFRGDAPAARLYGIAVAPAARGRGVAARLLERAEETARRRGAAFMRLEVRKDNPRAINLYLDSGYRAFARRPGYYEDGEEAIRFEKPLLVRPLRPDARIPYYRQSTDFTCGPAALMMVLCGLGSPVPLDRESEFALWREATSIYLIRAPGGCDPVGMAVTLARRGLAATIHASAPPPYFVMDGDDRRNRREIMTEAQRQFATEAARRGVEIRLNPLSADQLIAALDRNALAIVLVSSRWFDRSRLPHWIVAYAHDRDYIFAHDPGAAPVEGGRPDGAGLAIPVQQFDRIAAYGPSGLKAAVIVERNKQE